MAVTVEYCRNMIAKESRYKDSVGWEDKVAKMPANQVLAIYNRMLHSGEFDKKTAKTREQMEVKRVGYSQPTLFDFGLQI